MKKVKLRGKVLTGNDLDSKKKRENTLEAIGCISMIAMPLIAFIAAWIIWDFSVAFLATAAIVGLLILYANIGKELITYFYIIIALAVGFLVLYLMLSV